MLQKIITVLSVEHQRLVYHMIGCSIIASSPITLVVNSWWWHHLARYAVMLFAQIFH